MPPVRIICVGCQIGREEVGLIILKLAEEIPPVAGIVDVIFHHPHEIRVRRLYRRQDRHVDISAHYRPAIADQMLVTTRHQQCRVLIA
jgi:hypothetical protein